MQNNNFLYKHPFTVWDSIKLDYERDILNGVLNVGDKMPSIATISDTYNVSKNTAVRVLENMHNENLIQFSQGKGYFIKPFAREHLQKIYEECVDSQLNTIIQLAHDLKLTKEYILTKINKIYDK